MGRLPNSMTGRRPMRVDHRPQTGAKRNCISENEAMIARWRNFWREILRVTGQRRQHNAESNQVNKEPIKK